MGFMDKVKHAAQQGVKHPAILRGMRETQTKRPLSGRTEYELEVVNVDPDDPQSMSLWG